MNKQPTKVSIVVPTYDERENVKLLIDDISQTLDGTWNYEVIFVDDNSPDDTAAVVRNRIDANPRIRLLEGPSKLGLGTRWSKGLAQPRVTIGS